MSICPFCEVFKYKNKQELMVHLSSCKDNEDEPNSALSLPVMNSTELDLTEPAMDSSEPVMNSTELDSTEPVMDSSEPAASYTDHVHYEYTPVDVETHYDIHTCCFCLGFILTLVFLGVVALIVILLVVLDDKLSEIISYLFFFPTVGLIFSGILLVKGVYSFYSDLKKEGKRIFCLNVQKNRIAVVYVICFCYSKKQTISPLSRITKFRYFNNYESYVDITMADGRELFCEVHIPIFKIKQMIATLQRCNPEIEIVGPANPTVVGVNNADPTVLYDSTNSELLMSAESGSLTNSSNRSGGNEGMSSASEEEEEEEEEMQGRPEQKPSSLPPYLLPSSVLLSASATSSATASTASSSTPPSTSFPITSD